MDGFLVQWPKTKLLKILSMDDDISLKYKKITVIFTAYLVP